MLAIFKRWLKFLENRPACECGQDTFKVTKQVFAAIWQEYQESQDANSWQDVDGITEVVRPTRYLKYDNHNN